MPHKGTHNLNPAQSIQKIRTKIPKYKQIPFFETYVGARFSVLIQTGPADHPASSKIGTGSLSRG